MSEDLRVTADYDLRDIPGSESWVWLREITEGDSSDRKFYIKNSDRERFFLRVADPTTYDHKKDEYELLAAINSFGAPIPNPAGFGICNHGKSLFLQTHWIYGNSGLKVLPGLTKHQQYTLGTDAGLCLKLVHSCEFPPHRSVWETRQKARLEKVLHALHQIRQLSANEHKLILLLEEGAGLLVSRPDALLHGDFHIGNVVLSFEYSFRLIDFDNWQYGDPMADLANVLTKIRAVSLPYAIGVIDCYFHFQVTDEELTLMRFYAALDLAEQLAAAHRGNDSALAESKLQLQAFMHDFQSGRGICPGWYKRMRISKKALQFQSEE